VYHTKQIKQNTHTTPHHTTKKMLDFFKKFIVKYFYFVEYLVKIHYYDDLKIVMCDVSQSDDNNIKNEKFYIEDEILECLKKLKINKLYVVSRDNIKRMLVVFEEDGLNASKIVFLSSITPKWQLITDTIFSVVVFSFFIIWGSIFFFEYFK
jgi:hypothetical protein